MNGQRFLAQRATFPACRRGSGCLREDESLPGHRLPARPPRDGVHDDGAVRSSPSADDLLMVLVPMR